MIYRNATIADIPQLQALQQKYHVSSIREEDKKNGFVTTLFTAEQFQELIERENGQDLMKTGADGDFALFGFEYFYG